MSKSQLHLLCGKMASGKSTLADRIREEHAATLLSEDALLSVLYPGEVHDPASYAVRAERIHAALRPLLVSLLKFGVYIVLDFPANTRKQRAQLLGIAREADVDHVLHYIECSDETCKERLTRRAVAQPERRATDTLEMFEAITRYFEPPSEDEGLNIVRIVR